MLREVTCKEVSCTLKSMYILVHPLVIYLLHNESDAQGIVCCDSTTAYISTATSISAAACISVSNVLSAKSYTSDALSTADVGWI